MLALMLTLLLQTALSGSAPVLSAPLLFDTAQLVVEDATTSRTTFVIPYPPPNMDARCVIVYPRKSRLGWLIDRETNEVTPYYVDSGLPWPQWCDENKPAPAPLPPRRKRP